MREVGVHDDFFELGGHSLSSIRVVSGAAKLGLPLTVRQLFESPTINGLARALTETARLATSTEPRYLIPLRPTGSEVPLVITPPLGGTGLVLLPLSKVLRPSVPLWSFEDPRFVEHAPRPESVDGLARIWVTDLLRAMPDEPTYRLGGYSFGCMVAVEVARQLREHGKQVEQILLLDGGLPGDTGFDPLAFLFEAAADRGVSKPTLPEGEELEFEAALRWFADEIVSSKGFVETDPLVWSRAMLEAAEDNSKRMAKWKIRPVDVPVTLLRTTATAGDYGWSEALGQRVQIVDLDSTHTAMVEPPFVKILAEHIEALLSSPEV